MLVPRISLLELRSEEEIKKDPFNLNGQTRTSLYNINQNSQLYASQEPQIPLETQINNLKESDPSKYRKYLSRLTISANGGNEKAKELLGKIGEDAARQRGGYEGLNTGIYAAALTPATIMGISGASWVYNQLPKWIKTGVDMGLTVDGVRNFFSGNGVQKTYREAKEGNYGRAILSGIGDGLDVLGSGRIVRKTYTLAKDIKNISSLSTIKNRLTHPIETYKFIQVNKANQKIIPQDLWQPYIQEFRNYKFHNSGNIGLSTSLEKKQITNLSDKTAKSLWSRGHETGHILSYVISKNPKLQYYPIVEVHPRYSYNSTDLEILAKERFADMFATKAGLSYTDNSQEVLDRISNVLNYPDKSFLKKIK